MKLSFGMILIIILILIVASMLSFFWLVLTPSWSFTVVTDKTGYTSRENIQIAVTLKNTGYIPQTITSGFADPIAIWVRLDTVTNGDNPDVWDSARPPLSVHVVNTVFAVSPDKPLIRTFEFNQSYIDQIYKSKPYLLFFNAVIPKADINGTSSVMQPDYQLFYAYTEITVTPT